MRDIRHRIILIFSVVTVILAGCTDRSAQKEPTITVSYPAEKYLVDKIAGEDYDINTLIHPGMNPENYDPSISSLVALQNSKAYFRMNTPGFEEAVLTKIRSNFSDVEIIDVSKGVSRIKGTHKMLKDEGDPHLFSSVKNVKLIASNIFSAMIRLNPASKNRYERNYRYLKKELDNLDDSVANILKNCKGGYFMTMHPSLSYFARDYGLHQTAIEENGKEVTPRQLEQRIKTAKDNGVRVIFYESGHAPAQAALISERLGIKLVQISLISEDWSEQILKVANAIAEGCNN